ncbi:MAG: methionine--tRNA ligase [Bacteroidia bacterium]
MPKRHLITSALPYANGPIHIGHLVGCLLPADIYTRFLRMKGEEVLFVCGTDEHGVPITLKAKKEGKSPQDVVDENYKLIKGALDNFGISFDHFSRTTNALHKETSQEFFKTLYDKDVFNRVESEQLFDPEAQQFLADRYVTGTCPNCQNENAYGDQCERCGKTLSPLELINPKSTITGSKPILKKTINWYLPLDDLQASFLNEFIGKQKGKWRSTVYGQCNSWLKDGLKPRAMTRDLDWGVPVPIEGAKGKVMYVWFDAPIGYITATREATGDDWLKWWQDQETELVHFLGKDNIVFHCIIFPAMLHAHGKYILPTAVPANEFLNLEGEKISTSRNHAIWLHEYLQDFPDRQDELRYALASIMPETKDADFTWSDFQARINNELVAILGNFVNRVMVLSHKYHNGIVTDTEVDDDVSQSSSKFTERIDVSLRLYNQREALENYMALARLGNKYLQDVAPWHLAKEEGNKQAIEICMRSCLHLVFLLGKYAQVFLPNTSRKISKLLKTQDYSSTLKADHELGKPSLLFERIEDKQIEEQLTKLKADNQQQTNFKPMINYEDFTKLDLRSGTITEAAKVEKADKLLQLKVDIGTETRTVVSGIAEHFKSEELIGKKVTMLVNLEPRKLRGIESQGMILMAENEDGSLKFVSPDKEAENGSIIS